MSRYTWAVFLAAIFGITSWLGKSHPFGSDYVAPVPPTLGGKFPSTENFSPHGGETDNAKRSSEGLLQPISAATNNTISVKLSDLPVGKVIQIGELKFANRIYMQAAFLQVSLSRKITKNTTTPTIFQFIPSLN